MLGDRPYGGSVPGRLRRRPLCRERADAGREGGRVALYQGLPYELPFGVDLYEEVYESTLAANTIPARQRGEVLDHSLRDRADAADLVRQLERGRTQAPAPADGGR